LIRSEGGNALLRAVALPTAIILLVLAVIVGGVLDVSTSRTDALALSRQTQRVSVAVEQTLKAVTVDQEASTYWDDAVTRTRERPLDLEWLDNNLGVWFNTYYQIDEAYLLDQRDAPIYAMQNGRRAAPASFQRVANPSLKLAGQLRKRLLRGRLLPDGSVGKTVGASEVALVGGRPALISLKPIVSETGNIPQAPRSEYLHVAVRYLDGSFLARVAKLYVVDEPRFSRAKPQTSSVAIRSSNGAVVGYITWKPFEPGRAVESEMLPVLLATLIIVGALISLLLMRIRRSRMDLEASRAQAQHLAFHDGLTGLANRALFEDHLALALSRRGTQAAVLLLDLDRFKNVNDTLGHQAGDLLIQEFGRRLASLTRESDTIARFGGDEFAILIENASLPIVSHLAERILEDIRRPFDIVEAQVHVGVSIGIAMSQDFGSEPLDLVRKADIALYRAKEGGRKAYRLFSPEMDESVRLRGTIEEELRDAVATGKGLCLHYQPLVGSDGKVVGLEALLRWQHPGRGLIAPDQFVSVAEETGLIVPLGEWVLRQACLASRAWRGLFVAVNLSPVQFHAPDFYAGLMRIVRETRADPSAIQLEVTERVLLEDDDSVRAILARLRAAGFKIVLDDFGTGYSSLSYLRKFEVDKIKIDGSFVQHLGELSDSAAIVTAVLALGRAMGLTVSAEGVETADQRTFLQIAGCTEMQGHHFSPALPESEIDPLLERGPLSSAAA
jgi:diguanylate cyclase (GGDEF)-like protein